MIESNTEFKFDSNQLNKELGRNHSKGLESNDNPKADKKTLDKKKLNLTASQAAELMRRFNDLECAHFDLQQRHGR